MSNTVMPKIREKYMQRFADILEPLQSRLVELEQNLDSIKEDHLDKQKARLDVLTEINKTKLQIENAKKNLECSRDIPIVRSENVPENIQDYNVWNDCWYDEQRKLFVTHNKYFIEIPDAGDRPHQIQYTKETGDYGIVALSDKVKFRFGYPSVIQKNSKGEDVWFLLPTMTDSMLTTEIVSSRLQPISQYDAILYETESESWIEILGTQLPEREYELACKIIPHIVKTPLEVLKASAGRPYNQKLFEQQMAQINDEK